MENREKITNRFLATSLRIFSGEELTNGVCKKKKEKKSLLNEVVFYMSALLQLNLRMTKLSAFFGLGRNSKTQE